MGIITIEKSDHLYWLGRYTERVHTTLKLYLKGSDRMIDSDPNYYAVFAAKLVFLIFTAQEKILENATLLMSPTAIQL